MLEPGLLINVAMKCGACAKKCGFVIWGGLKGLVRAALAGPEQRKESREGRRGSKEGMRESRIKNTCWPGNYYYYSPITSDLTDFKC